MIVISFNPLTNSCFPFYLLNVIFDRANYKLRQESVTAFSVKVIPVVLLNKLLSCGGQGRQYYPEPIPVYFEYNINQK